MTVEVKEGLMDEHPQVRSTLGPVEHGKPAEEQAMVHLVCFHWLSAGLTWSGKEEHAFLKGFSPKSCEVAGTASARRGLRNVEGFLAWRSPLPRGSSQTLFNTFNL